LFGVIAGTETALQAGNVEPEIHSPPPSNFALHSHFSLAASTTPFSHEAIDAGKQPANLISVDVPLQTVADIGTFFPAKYCSEQVTAIEKPEIVSVLFCRSTLYPFLLVGTVHVLVHPITLYSGVSVHLETEAIPTASAAAQVTPLTSKEAREKSPFSAEKSYAVVVVVKAGRIHVLKQPSSL